MTFDGFISYSHAADGRLAPAVQRGLHRLAKPWHRRRALWIFRDQTGLAVTPALWSSIQTALDGSEYFVLLASPEAARSPWVNREIEHWIATKSADRVLPVVTEGEWAWDGARGDFTEESTAVPPSLRGVFAEEPFFLDLRWARGSEHLSLHHIRFRDAIAQLAAPMHGVSKDELEGEDVRQHRRARRLLSGAVATLAVLALLATVTGVSAVHNASRAREAAAEALRQRHVADGQRDNAERSAAEARRQQVLADQQQALARQQRARASQAAAEASRSEQEARRQQEAADQASAEAHRQQQLADQASTRTQEQQKLAKEASDRAQRLQQEARRLAAAAAEQRRLADRAAAEAKAQQAKADQQQRIAISRRLMNQAATTVGDDAATALKLGTAAQTLDPGAETRRQFSGVVASSHYAGTVSDVTAAEFGADGVLAAIDGGGHVSLWDLSQPWKPVRISTLVDAAVRGAHLEFSRDRRTLAFVTPANQAVVWDVSRPSRPVRLSTLVDDEDIDDVALSGDGITAATGDQPGAVSIWDITDRTHPIRLARFHDFEPHGAYRVTFTPNGRFLLVDHVIFEPVYDLTDRAHPGWAAGLMWTTRDVFSPDGVTMAQGAGAGTGSVELQDMTDWYAAPPAKPHNPGVTWTSAPGQPVPPSPPSLPFAAAQSSSAQSSSAQSSSAQSPAADPTPIMTPPPLPTGNGDDELGTASPSASENVPQPPTNTPPDVATGGELDPNPYYSHWGISGLSGTVTAVAFSPDGSQVIAGDENGMVALFDVKDWQHAGRGGLVLSVHGHGTINTVSVDPKTGLFVAADGSGTATLWSVPPAGEQETLATVNGSTSSPRATSFSPDGSSLIAAGSDGTARIWNTKDPRHPVRSADRALRSGALRSVAVSPDQRRVATLDSATTTLKVAETAHPDHATTLLSLPVEPGYWYDLGFTFGPDGRTLAVATFDELTLWDVADVSHPVLLSKAESAAPVNEMAFSPDGHVLAMASTDSVISLWKVGGRSAPVKLTTLTGHSKGIAALAFSPNGRYLATGGSGGASAILWDVTDPARAGWLASLIGAGTEVGSLAFSADGRTLATAESNGTVTVWDSGSPTEPIRLRTVKAYSEGKSPIVMFGNDGRILAVATRPTYEPPSITLWDFGKLNGLRADPAEYACGITGRGLNTVEWARFVPELPYRRTCSH